MAKPNRTILTYGTFDLFHIGHLNILERAKELGDFLIVAVSTDEFNEKKGKKSFFNYDERSKIVSSCRHVDLVIPETSWEQKEDDIKKYNISAFVMGHDWEGRFDNLNSLCDVIYLPRTPGISSTKIKMLSSRSIKSTLIQDLKSATSTLSSIVSKFEDLE